MSGGTHFHIIMAPRFKRDYKRLKKTHNTVALRQLTTAISMLVQQSFHTQPDRTFRDHQLHGRLDTYRELHLDDDVLLIYEIDWKIRLITLSYIVSHDELRRLE